MYKIGDKVRVFFNNELYYEEVKIIWSSDDEETFELENKKNQSTFQGIKREHIFYEYELDKLAICMIENKIMETDDIEDMITEHDEIIAMDVNWQSIAETIVENMSSIEELEKYMEQILSPYGTMGVFHNIEDEMYYLISST